jgi:hypothetical protein
VPCKAEKADPLSANPKTPPPPATSKKDTSLEGQLGDAFLLVFETFTGRR